MNDIVNKYPLDLTGTSPENLVLGEPHTLEPGLNRAAVPRYGAFYTESLAVRDASTGELLTPNDQYVPIMYYAEPSERSGKEVCTGIIVTDGTVANEITIDYQVVGGDYANITQIIIDLIENLNLDDREVTWGDLLGRPDAFPPAPHLHDLGDIYGFEYLVQQLELIRQAILYGDVESHEEIRQQIEARYQAALTRAEEVRTQLEEHSARTDNPHEVTKAQTGLGNVSNYADASVTEAEEGLSNSRFMTPNRVRQAIVAQVGTAFDTHRARVDNPHAVTKAQVGLGNVNNNPDATEAEAIEGTRSDRYITPPTLVAAINSIAGDQLAGHIDDKGNPHAVTKAQVGLGAVENLPLANVTDAQDGVRNDRYMTALRVKEAITHQVGNALDTHVARVDNPHQVTKAQVGLGNLPNAKTSSRTTDSEAELLTAKGLFDHIASTDHDGQYVKRNTDNNVGSLELVGSRNAGNMGSQYGNAANNYVMYVHGNGTDDGGIVVRANDNNNDENSYAAINDSGALAFYVKAQSGTVHTRGGFSQVSDRRRKTDIRPIEDALTKALALNGTTYERTDLKQSGRFAGLIAQDVLQVLPEAVTEDVDGFYMLDYDMIIALLVEAIKDLNTKLS